MTIGIRSAAPLLALTGTFVSVKLPSKSVFVDTRGFPETSASHCWQATVGWLGSASKGASAVDGMYTRTPGTGSGVVFAGTQAVAPWRPARTVPVRVVVVPPSHATCCWQRPVHGTLLPHTSGFPPAPQTSGAVHVPQGPIVPPQPSPAMPQLYPKLVQVPGMQTVPPSGLATPPHVSKPPPPQYPTPPQSTGPQSMTLPQPSPTFPQLRPSFAHVVGVHAGIPPAVTVGFPHLL